MYLRTNFVACLLTLSCLITLVPGIATAQTDKVKTSMAALKAETGKLGAPKVQGHELYFGTTKATNDLVDAVVKANGGAASLFVKNGDQYVRVATTLKKADGTSAVGTTMDAKNPALAKLNSGEPFYGDAPVLGKTYDTGYEPIKDASGVIGAYFVGYPK
jgi:Cache 3/Cache 2 fusion domain